MIFTIMTHSIMTLNMKTLSIMPIGIMTLSIMTMRIMTHSMKRSYVKTFLEITQSTTTFKMTLSIMAPSKRLPAYRHTKF